MEGDSQMASCMESFLNCSLSLDYCSMAKAGWRYIGDGHVQTMCCRMIVRNWKETYDPWRQHAILDPCCSFLKQQKDQDFINMVQADLSTVDNEQLEQQSAELSPEEESEYKVLLKVNDRRKKRQYCLVCEEEPRAFSYLPCGHFACCLCCDPAQLKCPSCKVIISQRIRTFLP
ncbi:baculoviral IAP repeat-containing protein 8-like [Ylistrum balloti]|uniref:baculoviral IAP repeat-containing protein 8-like n=1 Tax=Ylistrum balloti TaxID=509963 RepID=UPI002905A2B5|nr:baculoviral IAP repeat-containing protein 8-like [Ylistrum balloti]